MNYGRSVSCRNPRWVLRNRCFRRRQFRRQFGLHPGPTSSADIEKHSFFQIIFQKVEHVICLYYIKFINLTSIAQNHFVNSLETNKFTMTFVGLICLVLVMGGDSKIVISSPLVTPFPGNEIPYLYSNIGHLDYDKSQSYDLVISNVSLCNSTSLTLPTATFLVVQEQFSMSCSATSQALVAEQAGAKGVIFGSGLADLFEGNTVLADDGNGKRVHIPCLFITTETFQQLSGVGSKIEIVTNFPLPRSEKSTLTFFLSASQRSGYVFLKRLGEDYQELKQSIKIKAVYYTFASEYVQQQNCFSENYCSYDFDNYQQGVGQPIILEQLHQDSILKQLGPAKWFEYISAFDDLCSYNWLQAKECRAQADEKAGIPPLSLNKPLDTLDYWRQQQKKFAFQVFPEVAINGFIFAGNFDYPDFIVAVCDSIESPPPFCSGERGQPEVSPPSGNKEVIRKLFIFLVVVLVMLLLSACFYRKCVQQESTPNMVLHANEMVADYAGRLSNKGRKSRQKPTKGQQMLIQELTEAQDAKQVLQGEI